MNISLLHNIHDYLLPTEFSVVWFHIRTSYTLILKAYIERAAKFQLNIIFEGKYGGRVNVRKREREREILPKKEVVKRKYMQKTERVIRNIFTRHFSIHMYTLTHSLLHIHTSFMNIHTHTLRRTFQMFCAALWYSHIDMSWILIETRSFLNCWIVADVHIICVVGCFVFFSSFGSPFSTCFVDGLMKWARIRRGQNLSNDRMRKILGNDDNGENESSQRNIFKCFASYKTQTLTKLMMEWAQTIEWRRTVCVYNMHMPCVLFFLCKLLIISHVIKRNTYT